MGKFRDFWDKSKDGSRHGQRSFLRFAIVLTLLFILFLLIKHGNLFVWVKSAFTLRRQERQIEQLRRENDELRKTASELLYDRDSLETFAREEYFFCEPGEDVYIIP